MSNIQEIEEQIKSNFEEFITTHQKSFEDDKTNFYHEFDNNNSMQNHHNKHELQKSILKKSLETIKILSPIIQKFNERNKSTDKIFKNTKMSSILSLLTDIIIWTSDKFIEVLHIIDNEINKIQKYLSNPEDIQDIIIPIVLETIKAEKLDIESLFRNYNDETIIIQNHWLNILSKPDLLDQVPKDIFQVFESSMFFEDSDIVSFIIDNYKMLSSEYRIKWLFNDFKYINNIINKKIELEIEILINDIDFLFGSYLKNPENIHNIIIICFTIIYKIRQININVPISKLIRFISILLTVIAKLDLEKNNIEKDKYVHTVCLIIDTINKILDLTGNINRDLTSSYPILDSYLVYLIPSILNGIYGTNEEIDIYIDKIISKVSTERMMIIYMASTCPNVKIKIINGVELDKWKKIYEQVESDENFDEIIDELLSSCVINPVFLPNNVLADKYLIESSLWEKPENPYNRESLTIEDLEEYNERPEIKEKIKSKMNVIKEVIKRYKK